VSALGIGIGTDGAKALKSGQDALWGSQDGDRVRGEAGACGVACFELTLEDVGREGELFLRQSEGGAKEDLCRPASGESHESHERHAAGDKTLGVKQVGGRGDEGLRVERDQVGLLFVDLLLVGGVDGRVSSGVSAR